MKGRTAVLGLVLVLVGIGGLAWLFHSQAPPWGGPRWPAPPWGGRGMFGGRGPGWMGPGMMGGYGGPGVPGGSGPWSYEKRTFKSTGERIYYSGISAKDGPIPIAGGPMWLHMGPVGCVACHGVMGRGGVPVMMGTAVPEDIRYEALTKGEPEAGKAELEHPPYTDALIKRAITQGVDSAGKPLDWTMPRWQMSDQDANDVIAYLKTLK